MPIKRFADTTNNAKTMIAGLKANPEVVAKRGIDEEFTNSLDALLETVKTLDSEQEALKDAPKTKTDNLNREINKLNNMYSEARKIIKITVDQVGWREYGIEDSK